MKIFLISQTSHFRQYLDLIFIMSFTSFVESAIFSNLKNLIRSVNKHADLEEYVVVITRIKKSKLKIKRKVWLKCNHEEKTRRLTNETRRHCDSRLIDCFFNLTIKRDDDTESWVLKIVISQQNHEFINLELHSALRKMTFDDEMKNDVLRQLMIHIISSRILFTLRLEVVNSINSNINSIANTTNSVFKSRDIYNLKAKLRRDVHDSFIIIQTLIRELKKTTESIKCRRIISGE